MKGQTLQELDDLVAKRRKTHRLKQNQRYHLAKELGFSPSEATILQNWNEETIRRLAQERTSYGKS